MNDSTLKIIINAKDNASKVFKGMDKASNETMRNMKKIGIAGAGVAVGIGAASVKMAATFDASMTDVSTLIDTNVESMDEMKSAVLDMSKRTPVALGDLSSALYDVRSAGISAESAMKVLEDSARLGTAGLGTTKQSADLLTTAINAFGLQGRDSAEVANILFKTVKAGKTDIAKLSQAFGKMAGNAKAANITFEDAQAATASLTALTGKTSEAQNALAQVFLELTVKGGKLDKALQKNGSSLDELNERIGEKGLVGGMKEMQEELGLTETEFKNLFSSAEGGTSVFQLLTDAYDANNEASASMKDGTDLMSEAVRKQNEAAEKQYQILKNQLNAELINLGTKILPVLLESIPVMRQMWEDTKLTFDNVTDSLSDLILKAMQAVEWLGKIKSKATGAISKAQTTVSSSWQRSTEGGVSGLFQDVGKIGSWLLGSRESGGYIPETGPYLLHKGEEVIPANKGGRTINIYVQGGNYLDRQAGEKFAQLLGQQLNRELR